MKDDAPLKKTITVGGVAVEVYSIDGGTTWGSNVRQLQLHERKREKEFSQRAQFCEKDFSKKLFERKMKTICPVFGGMGAEPASRIEFIWSRWFWTP